MAPCTLFLRPLSAQLRLSAAKGRIMQESGTVMPHSRAIAFSCGTCLGRNALYRASVHSCSFFAPRQCQPYLTTSRRTRSRSIVSDRSFSSSSIFMNADVTSDAAPAQSAVDIDLQSPVVEEEVDPGQVQGTNLRVLRYPHPLLRAKNEEVTAEEMEPEIKRIAKEMLLVMYASRGVGLAAPQVGINKRLLVYNPEGDSKAWLQEIVMVNPRIVATSKSAGEDLEACLSFPGMSGQVRRSDWVKVEATRLNGKKFKVKLEGWKARIFQHEYDHLDGILYIDRLPPEERQKVQPRLDELMNEYSSARYNGEPPAL